ncbi:hypothetical protein KUTeg_008071 [Tegillarca granosa]|uniref:PiggyBac transposable element-derived protein domain-containing protein n=1 Tax=Tegillarca granosa TaxID=220873 RepID=A0ABQ9FB72_TEGGR|nr:hypothetical protein KUTeg_008071 [Tegillarca granosa]
MDNYFTNPELFLSLWNTYGTAACGTVRKVWQDLPQEFRKKKILNLNNRGDIQFRQKGPLAAVAWKDKKVVTVLSTIHSNSETIVQRSSHNRETVQFEQQDIACPIAVAQYTQYMGGVEKADQYTHPNHQPEPGKAPITYLKFTQEVIRGLINGYQQDRRQGRPPLMALENRLQQRHLPGTFATRSWCHECYMRVSSGYQQSRKQTNVNSEHNWIYYSPFDEFKHLDMDSKWKSKFWGT